MFKNAKIYIRDLIYALILVPVLFFIIKNFPTVVSVLRNEAQLQQLVAQLGVYGPILIVFLYLIYNVGGFMIFPGPGIMIASVYLYGPWLSIVLNVLGTAIGTTMFFFMIRSFGKEKVHKFLEKIAGHHDLRHFEHMFKKHENAALVITRIVPIIPWEIITIFCAIEGMDPKEFIILNFLAVIPKIVVEAFFFSEMRSGFSSPLGKMLLGLCILAVLIYVFRHPIKKFFYKEIRHMKT